MQTLQIKPLSVNACWQGKRFKTKEYKNYTKAVRLLLDKNYKIPSGKLQIELNYYFSNKSSDYDNPTKPIQDIICDFYKINDNLIYKAIITKNLVKKGEERIDFIFRPFQEY